MPKGIMLAVFGIFGQKSLDLLSFIAARMDSVRAGDCMKIKSKTTQLNVLSWKENNLLAVQSRTPNSDAELLTLSTRPI